MAIAGVSDPHKVSFHANDRLILHFIILYKLFQSLCLFVLFLMLEEFSHLFLRRISDDLNAIESVVALGCLGLDTSLILFVRLLVKSGSWSTTRLNLSEVKRGYRLTDIADLAVIDCTIFSEFLGTEFYAL